jgi:hypothetical protein
MNQLAPGTTFRNDPGLRASRIRPFDRGFVVDALRQRGFVTDDWRIVNQRGRWWYWTPEESWLYFDNGYWNPYQSGVMDRGATRYRGAVAFPPGYPEEEWRLVFHNGRWWFWTPNETWMYMQGGRWTDWRDRRSLAERREARERYGVGYRGMDGIDDRDERHIESERSGMESDDDLLNHQMPSDRQSEEVLPNNSMDSSSAQPQATPAPAQPPQGLEGEAGADSDSN